jgi:hypothetical protein
MGSPSHVRATVPDANSGIDADVCVPDRSYRSSKPDPPASKRRVEPMPRYLVERTFVDGLHIPINDTGAKTVAGVIATNADQGVTWVHSYVSEDQAKTFCVYDGPSPEAIRQVAEQNGLPVDAITQVRVLDPYFYADR